MSLYKGVDGELPLIKADKKPFRVKPETPGGMEVPNQDKLVYERLRRGDETRVPVEKLLPSPEKPSLPKKVDVKKAQKSADPIGDLVAQTEESELASTTIIDETGASVEIMFRTLPAAEEAKKTPEKPKADAKPVQKAPVTEKAPETAQKTAENGETFMIQLVSTRRGETSESEWKRLSKKHAEILGVLPHTVSEITTEKGTFYRLRARQFETKDVAAAVCDALKQKKQECLIVKE